MSETKTREPLVLSPLEDEPAIENLPEPIPMTPEQMAAQAEADERDRQRQLEWALVAPTAGGPCWSRWLPAIGER
jgi:hypothetical protein